MEREKLNSIIKDKNERLERETLRSAEQIIDAIACEQKRISESQERIAKLREELKALTVAQLDAANLLGE